MIYLSPSILSADLLQLKEQVLKVEASGADFIHIDVMDGHFVPNLTFGANMVKALKSIVKIPLDVHLMIEKPELSLHQYAQAGADIITVHQEACVHLHRTLQTIRSLGVKAGVSLNPATPVSTLEDVLDELDLILIMTVNPGFGGQKFIQSALQKIQYARKLIQNSPHEILLEVDGGITPETASQVVAAGANVLVAGNAVFAQPDMAQAIQNLRNAV